jgi:two-component system sensor histidine kinase UhpB
MVQGRLKSLLNQANISFEVSFTLEQALSKEHEIAVYRICQEAVTNCIKHSNANLLTINIESSEHFSELEIRDNGDSVKLTDNTGHYGLAFMQERSMALGGSFEVINDGGFTIKVKLPIKTVG